MVVLATPANPTGRWVSEGMREFVEAASRHALVVVDEAYVDYAPPVLTGLDLVKEGAPIVSLRTFSKIWGLAGLRIGYAVMPATLAAHARSVQDTFEVSTLAQVAALASLQDRDEIARRAAENARVRSALEAHLAERGVEYYPSAANFVCCRPADDPVAFSARMTAGRRAGAAARGVRRPGARAHRPARRARPAAAARRHRRRARRNGVSPPAPWAPEARRLGARRAVVRSPAVFSDFIDWIESLGFLAVFLLSMLDSVGLPATGDAIVITYSAASDKPLGLIILVAFLGGVCGDHIAYWVGRLGGARLLHRFLDPAKEQRLAEMMDKHAPWVLIFGRLVAAIRTKAAVLAGSARLDYARFTIWNALGCALWATTYAILGRTARQAHHRRAGVGRPRDPHRRRRPDRARSSRGSAAAGGATAARPRRRRRRRRSPIRD